jgi:DNA segregation ATPase FtsK/SpoIIIE-like protein
MARPGSETEQMLIDVAKKGRAYGIYLICATQRNTRGVMTGELQEQFTSRFCGYMDSNQEYAHVGRVPRDVYELMEKMPGRFMMKYSGTWDHIQVKLIPDHELERVALRVSGSHVNPVWTSERIPGNTSDKIPWNGSQAQKLILVRKWAQGFNSKPSIDNFMAAFNVKSSSTASAWINRVWYEERQ